GRGQSDILMWIYPPREAEITDITRFASSPRSVMSSMTSVVLAWRSATRLTMKGLVGEWK
ncbi:MAG: hypothetical protein OET45_05800, partial [Chromatiales bacterium]|nr:hypothetical protein [Chromatiales bacterium]